jgi:hypothetical protein
VIQTNFRRIKMRKFTMFLFLGLAFIFAGTVVQAQTTGSMSGTITDPNGAFVPGASVTVTNNATGASRTATTNSQGVFSVEALATGQLFCRGRGLRL